MTRKYQRKQPQDQPEEATQDQPTGQDPTGDEAPQVGRRPGQAYQDLEEDA